MTTEKLTVCETIMAHEAEWERVFPDLLPLRRFFKNATGFDMLKFDLALGLFRKKSEGGLTLLDFAVKRYGADAETVIGNVIFQRPNAENAEKIKAAKREESHNDIMRKALKVIEKGEGAFSRDPLTHAANCIDEMKEIARHTLERIGR